ncbi:hypothetical protein EDD22DRAFT_850966 [Suillus occidentalis]|nr:hypothetical protein EDD22DRAFT_850966 [Suillus occidentalis]
MPPALQRGPHGVGTPGGVGEWIVVFGRVWSRCPSSVRAGIAHSTMTLIAVMVGMKIRLQSVHQPSCIHTDYHILLLLREIICEEGQNTCVPLLEYLKQLHPIEWDNFVNDTKILAWMRRPRFYNGGTRKRDILTRAYLRLIKHMSSIYKPVKVNFKSVQTATINSQNFYRTRGSQTPSQLAQKWIYVDGIQYLTGKLDAAEDEKELAGTFEKRRRRIQGRQKCHNQVMGSRMSGLAFAHADEKLDATALYVARQSYLSNRGISDTFEMTILCSRHTNAIRARPD